MPANVPAISTPAAPGSVHTALSFPLKKGKPGAGGSGRKRAAKASPQGAAAKRPRADAAQ